MGLGMVKGCINMLIMRLSNSIRGCSRMIRIKDMGKCYSETNENIKEISRTIYSKAKANSQQANSHT